MLINLHKEFFCYFPCWEPNPLSNEVRFVIVFKGAQFGSKPKGNLKEQVTSLNQRGQTQTSTLLHPVLSRWIFPCEVEANNSKVAQLWNPRLYSFSLTPFKTCNQLELIYQSVHGVTHIWKCHLEHKQPQVSVRMCAHSALYAASLAC